MKDNTNFAELEEFLKAKPIPTVKSHLGFLEIIRKSNNETINSNLYAYFLSCDEQIIKSVFLETFLDIISHKLGRNSDKDLDFKKYVVTTEISVNYVENEIEKSGRIDLVLEDLLSQNVIMIENKIFHHLKNPLAAYWNHFNADDKKKIGVLLTLHTHNVPNDVKDKFINITHWEWISRIKTELDFDLIKDQALKLYLTDFIKTIENMSTTNQLNESAKFFFENARKVNQAYETIVEGHRFMIEQYRLIASKLGLDEYGNDISYRNFWDEKNMIDTYFTVTTEDIIQGNALKYKIIIELFRKDKDRWEELKDKFKDHAQFKDKVEGEKTQYYTHFLVKEYEISIEELNNFADHVVDNIQKHFGNLYLEIIDYLYADKNIDSWKSNLI